MNPMKKIYCRAYQTVFRAILPVLPYRDPAILHNMEGVITTLNNNHADKVMLVTDKGIRGLGLTDPLEKLLARAGIKCIVYQDTVANPTVHNVEEAKDIYLREHCQALIAFGGGSSMDCAKGIGARIARPNKSLNSMAGIIKVIKKIPLLIAIPTTAGTGSETTLAAVITDEQTHHKYAINDFVLIPKYAVLDPQVTVGLPKQLTATTGMDALTHAVEVYVGRSMTKGTKAASEKAVKLIFDNLETAYNNGNDMTARANMLQASFLAGSAFSRSYVGYVHAVAHSLGGKYGIPHGLANAVLLPHVLRAYGPVVYPRLAALAHLTSITPDTATDEDAALAFISHIEKMNKDMNIPTRLEGINKDDIPALAVYADKEANPQYPVPVLWDAKELETLYYLVL